MPVHAPGFMLDPFGFFDEGTALDVAPPARRGQAGCDPALDGL
jgi:hypothetical protein